VRKIKKIELKYLSKESLLKIMNIYQDLNKIDIIDDINFKILNENDNFKKQLLDVQIESIILSMNEKTYTQKENIKNYTFYYYGDEYIKIYMNKKSILSELSNILIDKNIKSISTVCNNKEVEINISQISSIKTNSTNLYFICYLKRQTI
jgi:hypothetical protein